jgi:Ca-activated chloride channel family protein
MFNPQFCENSRPDGIGILEIVPEPDSEKAPRQFVPLQRTELKGEITGPLAGLRLVQTFALPPEAGTRVVEALYRFPLPGDAAVTAVRVRFGDVDIRAALKERGQAETEYQEARKEGRQAALVTRETPDVFTLRIAGIHSGQEIRVETCYVQLARPERAGWSLRIPLTTSPRYVRQDERTSRHAHGQPLALLRDPGHRFALDLALRGAEAVTSTTHRLEVAAEGNDKRVRLQEGEVLPDRDCVLAWQPLQESDRPALQVWLHQERASGQVYFLALAAPPAAGDPGRGIPREVVLLVDHSGSMEGAKWQAADWAVERFLSELTERDAFALGLFHNTTKWLAKQPAAAEQAAVQRAVEFLKANRDNGGTEMGVALEQALGLQRTSGDRARHVLVITDAEVSDAGRILRLADQERQRPERRRVSLLCIDAAPNAQLANELAERGGGVARFLTSQPEEEDITTALDEVLGDWSEPVLTGLRLQVDRPRAEAAGRDVATEAGASAIDLGDLPAGRPVWVAGRLPGGDGTDVTFRLRTGKGHEVAACRVSLQQADERPALKALFGARRVRGLEYVIHSGLQDAELHEALQRLGYDPALLAPPSGKVYAENARTSAAEALRSLLVQESLDYGLACMETAFVAVRSEPGKPIEETIVVGNALPAGWSEGFRGGARGFFIGGTAQIARCMAMPLGAPSAALAPAPPVPLADSYLDSCLMESEAEVPPPEPTTRVVFQGIPQFTEAQAMLFDSSCDLSKSLPEQATITRLEIRFPDGPPKNLDPGLCLLIFVDDLAAPRARVKLADLLRQRGQRPLNLRRQAGEALRLVLVDAAGAWKAKAPQIEVAFGWH